MQAWRNYCFTLNLDATIEEEEAKTWIEETFAPEIQNSPEFKFIVFQLERAPETGRLHLQGYLEAKKTCRFTWIQRNWPYLGTAHFEPRNGTRDQAIAYCKKPESRVAGPWEFGQNTGQGHRSDLVELTEKIRGGGSILDIASEFPSAYIRYSRGIERLANLIGPRRKVDWEMRVIVLWGDSGSGKTHLAKEWFPDAYDWMPQRGNQIWWDGYNGETAILINEFANNFQFHYALRILDEPGIRVETKGGTVNLYAKTIVLTSMDSPTKWWPGVTENRYALYRRITECYRFDGVFRLGTARRCCDTFPFEFEHEPNYPTRARLWVPLPPEHPGVDYLTGPKAPSVEQMVQPRYMEIMDGPIPSQETIEEDSFMLYLNFE